MWDLAAFGVVVACQRVVKLSSLWTQSYLRVLAGQQRSFYLFSLLYGRLEMVTLQVHVNGNPVCHEETDYCAVQTQYDWDVNVQESSPQRSYNKHNCLDEKYVSLLDWIVKKVQKFLSRQKVQNWHHWNVLDQYSKLDDFSCNVKYHILGCLFLRKTWKYSWILVLRIFVEDFFNVFRTA